MDITPGIRADAVLVSRLVGGRYVSWPKQRGRRKILRSLRDVGPELVLDLWGGGGSAKAMTDDGLSVLSVDDGRAFGEHGISVDRGRRALAVLGTDTGYQTAFGEATEYAARADAAFLDFMGHWAPDKKRVLMACRHMKAVAVTLMPERTPLGRLDDDDWRLAYKALLEAALQMKVRWTYTYRRNDQNQQATVFFLRPSNERSCMDCSASLRGSHPAVRRCGECRRAHERTRLRRGLTPSEYQRLYAGRHNHYNETVRKTPEYRADVARRQRERYANDPEYREMKKRYSRGGRDVGVERTCRCGNLFVAVGNARYCSDDCRKQARRERHAEWRRTESGRACGAAYRARKKSAAVSGTAAEAIFSEEAA